MMRQHRRPRDGLRRLRALGAATGDPDLLCRPRYGADAQGRAEGGWPKVFEQPALFPGAAGRGARWKDLTGARRPDKPWLDGLPRLIFVVNMGDGFTASVNPDDWLTPKLGVIAGVKTHSGPSTAASSRMTKAAISYRNEAQDLECGPGASPAARVPHYATRDRTHREPNSRTLPGVEPRAIAGTSWHMSCRCTRTDKLDPDCRLAVYREPVPGFPDSGAGPVPGRCRTERDQ